MIPKECKRLAEVDFPIAVVSKHAAREKSIRHGHPSTLHLWWARRPLAACRAMLLTLLLPDPCDEHCPAEFREQARQWLLKTRGKIGSDHLALRQALLKFIGDFANWDLSSDAMCLEVARALVHAAHPEEPPLVVDPFAGGGSIPLEALRVGCEAFASDLNPVACLILKVMLEDIPRSGPELAEQLLRVGSGVKLAAEKELAEYYPADPDGARPIAYLWARTVRCESPNCGAEIPLIRSFWLSTKANFRRALQPKIVRGNCDSPEVDFDLLDPGKDGTVHPGTVSRAKATCLCCGRSLAPDRVREQLRKQSGGADVIFDAKGQRVGGSRLLCVVVAKADDDAKDYRLPNSRDYATVWKSHVRLQELMACETLDEQCQVPDEDTPIGGGSGAGRAFSLQRYGMMTFGDLFTARQKLTLFTHSVHIRRLADTGTHQSAVIIRALAPSISKLADTNSVICTWQVDPPRLRATFSRQALSTTWDFAEASPLGRGAGNYELCVKAISEVLQRSKRTSAGTVEQADAMDSPLPNESVHVWFTDPPYYDAVPYAELSDFFYCWLKRAVPKELLHHDRFDRTNRLAPKQRELVQDETKFCDGCPKNRDFFENSMAKVFTEGRRVLSGMGIGCVVFAHKTTEGWESLLSGMIRGGLTITGSWPISTELASRQRARESAALATSVHLVCRPRPEDAPVGDWAKILRELPPRVAEWMERLQTEGVRGADLVFACIGPALEIYSRYPKVVDAQEREIPLGGDPEAREPHRRGYLAYVWEVVGRTALEHVLGTGESQGAAVTGALEEDARLTALFLWTLQSTLTDEGSGEVLEQTEEEEYEDEHEQLRLRSKAKGFSLIFDVVRRFAQPLGIHLPDWEGRIITTEKGVVRLIPALERGDQLFGEEGAQAVADRIENVRTGPVQLELFPERSEAVTPPIRGRRRRGGADVSDESLQARRGATTLDRVHAAIILQASGRSHALRGLLKSEVERGSDFLRLANALSALYPAGSDEKRLLDAMLLAAPR